MVGEQQLMSALAAIASRGSVTLEAVLLREAKDAEVKERWGSPREC